MTKIYILYYYLCIFRVKQPYRISGSTKCENKHLNVKHNFTIFRNMLLQGFLVGAKFHFYSSADFTKNKIIK